MGTFPQSSPDHPSAGIDNSQPGNLANLGIGQIVLDKMLSLEISRPDLLKVGGDPVELVFGKLVEAITSNIMREGKEAQCGKQ